jgi:dienelactone hydrolase
MQPALLLLAALCGQASAEDLQCLKLQAGEPSSSTLFYSSLQRQAYAALGRRQSTYDELKTEQQISEYQHRLRSIFIEQLGGFPERTPLNAQVVGKLPGDGYTIEKIIFESQPRHHVTATLFLPTSAPPYPAVLVSSGHSRPGKAADYNQRFGIALARNGIASLCYDPIGQGERSQILTSEGKPQFTSTTQEHTLIGVGSILLGTNTARYRVWDGIRAIDYLATRPDIDAKRIGFTGCSGGGTLTSYVMALDERVACAAPSCYLTTFRRLIETIGPQDAEQNIFGQVSLGLDQPDYVLLRAPRPTLISSTTGDFFDIQGAWDNFRQAKRIFTRLGHAERVDLVEAEGGHGVQPGNLIGITRWMRRWLLNKDEPIKLDPIIARPEADLLCTEKGQVMLLPGERSVFDLNAEIEQRLAEQRRVSWTKSKADALAAVRKAAGVRPLAQISAPKMVEAGRVDRADYHIDKFVLHTDSGVPLPGLTYHPQKPGRDAYLYLHEGGKTADGAPGGPIEKLVNDGYVVVAIDLRGTGETATSGRIDGLFGDSKSFFLAYLLGQSLVGLHTEDALAGAQFVAHYKTSNPRKVHLIGVGKAAVAALHAAALEPDLFASVTLRRMPESWSSIVPKSVPQGRLTTTVHGALKAYDLPDLIQSIDASKLRLETAE